MFPVVLLNDKVIRSVLLTRDCKSACCVHSAATQAQEGSSMAAKARLKTEASTHIHHWTIDAPNGPMSMGVCSCGETKEFRNSSEDSIWDRQEGRSRWNDMGISKRRRTVENDN